MSSSILGTYQPVFLPFHTVHGVLKARILKWFAIPFSSGPHSVRPLHHDLPVLGGPTGHDELIGLLLQRERELSQRDEHVQELESYIDRLLVRIMESSPTLLQIPPAPPK